MINYNYTLDFTSWLIFQATPNSLYNLTMNLISVFWIKVWLKLIDMKDID